MNKDQIYPASLEIVERLKNNKNEMFFVLLDIIQYEQVILELFVTIKNTKLIERIRSLTFFVTIKNIKLIESIRFKMVLNCSSLYNYLFFKISIKRLLNGKISYYVYNIYIYITYIIYIYLDITHF